MTPRFFLEAVEKFDRAAVERRAELILHDAQVVENLERQQAGNRERRAQLAALHDELRKIQGDYDAAVRLMEEALRRDARSSSSKRSSSRSASTSTGSPTSARS